MLEIIGFITSAMLLLGTAWLIVSQTGQRFNEQVWIFVGTVSLQLGSIVSIASYFSSLTPLGWLSVQGALTLMSIGGVWLIRGRSSIFRLQSRWWPDLRETMSTISPVGWTGVGGILIFIILTGLIQAFTPLSNPAYGDERMYHASRVIYWLQNQSVFPYDTHNDRQVVFSFGGEIFFLWSLVFLKSEAVGRLIFWSGYPLSSLGIYLLTRSLNIDPNKAIITTLVFTATPIVARHATGLKPELWLTFFVLGVAFWLVQLYKDPKEKQFAFFWLGVLVALSINVKFTALLLILLLGALFWHIPTKEDRWSSTGITISGLAVGLLLSGSMLLFSNNLINYGHILGPESMRQVHASEISVRQLYTHLVRLPFLLFELPEVPLVTLQNRLTSWGNVAMHALGADQLLPLENNTNWPGYFTFSIPQVANKFSLGGLVWLPLLIASSVEIIKLKTNRNSLLILVLMDLLLLAGIVFLVRWMAHSKLPERFLIAPYALGLVIGVDALKSRLDKIKFIQIVVLLLVIYTVYPEVRSQFMKTETALAFPSTMTLLNMPFAEALNYIPDHSTILLAGSQDVPDYPLFAPNSNYSNRVISWGKSTFNSDRLRQLIDSNHVTHVLIQNDQQLFFHWDPPVNTSEMVEWLTQQPEFDEVPLQAESEAVSLSQGHMRLFETQEIHQRRLEEIKRYLQNTQFPAEAPFIKIDSALHHQVGLEPEALEFPRQPELFGPKDENILWLGQGEQGGLRGVLWSQTQTQVNLHFDLVPGPSMSQDTRRVFLSGLVGGKLVSLNETFTGPDSLDFQVPLRSGPNPFTFFTTDRPDIFIHEAGDTRPLIVGVRGLTIGPLP
jgi:4-amino-4-deoxy-L-arabinose transferase-like glycosyltransferase